MILVNSDQVAGTRPGPPNSAQATLAWVAAYGPGNAGVRTVDRLWPRASCVACVHVPAKEAA